jgi:hypothetical protein
MSNIIKKEINLCDLKQGMTVEYKNEILTVSKNDIKYNSFMGYSFRGDASKKTITQIFFKVPTNNGFVLR